MGHNKKKKILQSNKGIKKNLVLRYPEIIAKSNDIAFCLVLTGCFYKLYCVYPLTLVI